MELDTHSNSTSSLPGNSLVGNPTLRNAVFQQLLNWFERDQNRFAQLKSVGLVGPRREELTSFVYLEKGTGRKLVLKSFRNLCEEQPQQQIVSEVMVPLIVNSQRLLACQGVFVYKKVRLIRNYISSMLIKREATCGTY